MIQQFLTGMEPTGWSRVAACRNLFRKLRISEKSVQAILDNPDAYWQPVVLCRNGKTRLCFSPHPALRYVQYRIYIFLRRDEACRYCQGTVNGYPATAFRRGSSIVQNARFHRHNRSSWCVDLRDAFASIRTKVLGGYLLRTRVFTRGGLTVPPRDAAWVCSRLLTYRGRLRQGASVSPFLFNLLLRRLDETLAEIVHAPSKYPERYVPQGLYPLVQPDDGMSPWAFRWIRAKQQGPRYTRYGDDLCFSLPEETLPQHLKEQIRQCVRAHGYRLSTRKERQGRHGVMEFPGCVVVHGAIRPPRSYIRILADQFRTGCLTEQQLRGHKGFLGQFRTGVWKRCLRAADVPPQLIACLARG